MGYKVYISYKFMGFFVLVFIKCCIKINCKIFDGWKYLLVIDRL